MNFSLQITVSQSQSNMTGTHVKRRNLDTETYIQSRKTEDMEEWLPERKERAWGRLPLRASEGNHLAFTVTLTSSLHAVRQ